ncbi:hypothetical protein [Exiguobacterium sp. s39]|uniref:hypothetical protein n=1 Tax=Exiguobacterium sp. s39 TaxID=2751198 RepID=UPI001BECEAEC|nr:hypothetical protein [Exiguobacterium sp. s39]
MHGSVVRNNLNLTNKLYSSKVEVEFIKIQEEQIETLMKGLSELKKEIIIYYENDYHLIEETEKIMGVFRKILGTEKMYSSYLKENNEVIVNYFSFMKQKKYTDLFKNKIVPIITSLKIIRKNESNSYIKTLEKMVKEKKFDLDSTYVLIKHKLESGFLNIDKNYIKTINANEFLKKGIFVENIIFLGTPNYFDEKFSKVFYAENIYFLGYSCFENRIKLKNTFPDLINENEIINTTYENVTFNNNFSGGIFEGSGNLNIQKDISSIINNISEKKYNSNHKRIETKLVTVSNGNYIFLPLIHDVNIIDREILKVINISVNNLQNKDLLVFRNQNAIKLVQEVADKIIGDRASEYRNKLEKWKKRLRYNVKKKGLSKVSSIFISKYNILIAKENNIKNWMNDYSIKPSCLEELLFALKFDSKDRSEILKAAEIIVGAHISAGRHISQSLIESIDENLESIIDENGYYIFKSKEFEGASFNVEEIKSISSNNYFISEENILKIIKRTEGFNE